jgi:hypothetical protein
VGVEVPGGQITPPRNGAAIGHLKNPEPGWTLGIVKGPTEPVNQQEDVLKQVVRFGCVSENTVGYSTDHACVATKEQSEGIPIATADTGQKRLVRSLA